MRIAAALRALLPAAVALPAVLFAVPLRAASYTWTLDPASTEVTFLLDAFMHKVHGTAVLVRGEIRFDDAGSASGEFVVDATSAETGNKGRDEDMHTKVLESAKFGEIVLSIDGYEGKFDPAATSHVRVKGRFRIHGAEHPLTLDMTLKPDDGGAAKRLDATGSFSVPYVEWGMKNPSKPFLRVGKAVEVSVDAKGALAASD
jgi:polyisoprenoid-binding protein YceI